MIKKDAPVVQQMFQEFEVTISEERREALALKGRVLYGKYCGLKGHGICAESFAEYHIWRGELVVARDLLAYLSVQAERLQAEAEQDDTFTQQCEITNGLIERIGALLGQKTEATLVGSIGG
jgi:hypothetical protein